MGKFKEMQKMAGTLLETGQVLGCLGERWLERQPETGL